MADPEHLAILRQGVDVWNEWREDKKTIRPDLMGAKLQNRDLQGIYFSNANLVGADLYGAKLNKARFTVADLTAACLAEADLTLCTFARANLGESYLNKATFTGADLGGAYLRGANLREANLREVDLGDGNLSTADLSGSDLYRANLRGAKMTDANLSEAKLIQTNLSGADLCGATCGGTVLYHTVLSNVDLSEVNGLESVQHVGPSSIGIDTIYRSNGKIPIVFLRGAGVSDDFITYMASLTGRAFDFYSCFISYSAKDEVFAKRLHADLQAQGVRCWFANEDMKIGAPILSEIDSAIRLHDKLLLILSEDSVQSRWVEHEVFSATTKEFQQPNKQRVLFPVRIDDAVMDTDVAWAQTLRGTRHIGDFTAWRDHDAYQHAFDRLLRDLKQSGGKDLASAGF